MPPTRRKKKTAKSAKTAKRAKAAKASGKKSPAKTASRRSGGTGGTPRRAAAGMAALIAVLATGAGTQYVQAHGGARAPAFQCDPALWDPGHPGHVYSPDRFQDSNRTCTLAVGTITLVKKDDDMDYHLRLHLDGHGQDWMLAQSNRDHQGGDLVLEIVCAHEANRMTTDIHRDACAGYQNRVYVPKVGEHVAAVGTFVTDFAHYTGCPVSRAAQHCWNELHPVTSITRIE